jgi:LPXTG-site transpeptidase (sortase) family protein
MDFFKHVFLSARQMLDRHRVVVATAAIALGLFGYLYASTTLFFPQVFNYFSTTVEYERPQETKKAVVTGPTLSESGPVHLRIPSINVDVDFSAPLGLKENREVEVPKEYDRVGWYKYGPTPGELGPAVVFGHVDSVDGAAIFYLLGQVKQGDSVFVTREDGSTAEFLITSLERVEQDSFPTQKVYGNIDHAGLRLVTCTGTYNKGELRYTHNLIVYAKLVGS